MARSWASWTEPAQVMAKPVLRADMTSLWSPKIDKAWQARDRAETRKSVGSISPAILCMFGSISIRPWEAVKVVVRAPAESEPWTAPEAPPSDCISTTSTVWPKMFFRPWADHSSASSPIVEDGVMG